MLGCGESLTDATFSAGPQPVLEKDPAVSSRPTQFGVHVPWLVSVLLKGSK